MNSPYERLASKRWGGVWSGALVVLALCGACIGCGRKSPDYIPSAKTSREALDTALSAWVNGQPVGPINTVSPPIQVVDSAWWKGQRLASYEVIGEETTKEGLPCFSVRLHKSQPHGEETVRYLVTGKAQMWIYREEDYKNSQSWEGYKYR
jgi:predicted small lipoprotein YifL